MSAGQFVPAFYVTDSGETLACQIQPETAALVIDGTTNVIPAGPATQPIEARMGGVANRSSWRARYVRLRWTAAPPTGYDPNGILRVPVLTPGAYAAYRASGRFATGTYLGAGVTVVSFKAENDGNG